MLRYATWRREWQENGVGRSNPEGYPMNAGAHAPARLSLTLSVLGVREDGAWCAIALDMSLRGYGDTFETALQALLGAVQAQLSFAVRHDNLDQVFIPAEPHYFQLYANTKREALKRTLQNRVQPSLPDYRAGDVLLPAPDTALGASASA